MRDEDLDLEKYRDMDPVQMMYAIRKELEFAMPPVGLTVHTANFGGYRWVRNTWRCEVEGCYYVCTPRVGDKRSIEDIIKYHRGTGDEYRCPTPPRRESLPSGLAEIEKLWREIDDVVDAIKDGVPYRSMTSEEMRGYVRGLAFSIVMKDKDFWPDIKSVSQQAGRRWKMRKGQLPHEATPTRHENNFSSLGQQGGWRKDKTQPAAAPAKSTPPRKRAAPAKALPPETAKAVKSAATSGMFTVAEVADIYKVTEAQVRQVMG